MTGQLNEFYYPINWWGHTFNGVRLEFNCEVSVTKVTDGQKNPQTIDHYVDYPAPNVVYLGFPLARIEANGLIITFQYDANLGAARIKTVILNLVDGEGEWPYPPPQIQQLNDTYSPKQ